MRALVVDDSATMRMVLRDILEGIGLEVDCAEDGAAALEMVGSTAYEIVLLDWNLPRLTGLEVVKTVRRDGNNLPIVMVTTEGQRKKILEALSAGANDYLTKPFVKETLVSRVGRLLPAAFRPAAGGPRPSPS